MEKSYKHVENIIEHPLSKLRMVISKGFFSKSMNTSTFERLLPVFETLCAKFPDLDSSRLNTEVDKIRDVFAQGSCEEYPDLEHPLTQLMWGSAMTVILCDNKVAPNWPDENRGNGPITDAKIWKLLKDSPGAKKELKRQASFMVSKSFCKKDTKVRWGATNYPGIGYYFNPQENMINMDLVWGMIAGFEHARSANMHELAHSQGTIAYPPKLQKIKEEMEQYQSVKNFSIENYTKLAQLREEWDLRFRIFDEAENNFANGFVKSLTENGLVDQDLSESVNIIETTICDFGNKFQKNSTEALEKQKVSSDDKFYNLKSIIRYGFYLNNDLFENTPEEWKKTGVHLDWLEGVDKNGNKMTPQECLDDLLDCCRQLEEEQLPLRIFASPTPQVIESVNNKSKRRAEIIDDIMDRYFSTIIEEKLKDVQEEIEQQAEKLQQLGSQSNQNNNQEQDDQQQQSGGGTQGQDSETQEGDEQDNQQSGGGAQDQDGETQEGDEQDNQQSGGGAQGQDSETQEGDEQDGQQQQGGGSQGQDEQTDSQEAPFSGTPNKKENKIKVEGLGEVDAIDIPEDDPNRERNKNLEVEDNDNGNTADDVINDRQSSSENDQDVDSPNDKADSSNDNNVDSDTSNPGDVAHGNGGNIQYRIKQNSGTVRRYKNIISKNKSLIKKISTYLNLMTNKFVDDNVIRNKDFAPKGDVQDSLNLQSIISRIHKTALNQELKEDDFKHFDNPEDPVTQIAPTDIIIMIDTSGSMKGAQTDRFAVELGCAFYEAAKSNPYYNVYVGLMTNPVQYIAEPGNSDADIAKNLASVYDDNHYSDDKITDCILNTADKICNRKQDYDQEGMAHYFFITDGYHTDDSADIVQSFLDKSSVTTFNWLLTDRDDPLSSKSRSVAAEIIVNNRNKRGTKAPEYVMCKNNLEVAKVLPKLLAKRVKECSYLPALNSTTKRGQLQKAMDGCNVSDTDYPNQNKKNKNRLVNFTNFSEREL